MSEIWLPVVGYEGLYEVSNLGRVRSLNWHRTGQTKVLSQNKNKIGYLTVGLCKNGKQKFLYIHRLVAEAFLPNWFDEPEVNHLDENKKRNHVDNLEWCDHKYNINYGTRNDRIFKKTTNGKLSKVVLQLTKTGELVREWSSTMEVRRTLGFNRSGVSACCLGKKKSYKGYIWRYKESA